MNGRIFFECNLIRASAKRASVVRNTCFVSPQSTRQFWLFIRSISVELHEWVHTIYSSVILSISFCHQVPYLICPIFQTKTKISNRLGNKLKSLILTCQQHFVIQVLCLGWYRVFLKLSWMKKWVKIKQPSYGISTIWIFGTKNSIMIYKP